MKGSKLIFITFILAFVCGCVTTQEQYIALEGRVINLESRLDTIERKLSEFEKRSVMSSEREGESMYQALKSLESEIYSMRNDIDTNTSDIADIKRKLQDIELEIIELKKVLEERKKALVATTNATSGKGAPETVTKETVTPETLYSTALKLVKSSQFEMGIKKFEEFLKKYPTHPLAANAFYWIGEAYYGLGKYRDAILQFEDFRRKYPHSAKVPASLLKEALAFLKLQDKGAARILLGKLIKDYPKSQEALKARELLKNLK